MNSFRRGILAGAVQCALVLSLTGKLLYDRATCPRIWVKTQRYDPNLPIRGRYLSLMLTPEAGAPYYDRTSNQRVAFFLPERPAEFESFVFRRDAPEIWVEVTIPRSGPPRPIRLGLKRQNDAEPVPVN